MLKARRFPALAVAAALVSLSPACSSTGKKAREELAGRGVEFSDVGFFDHIRSGDTEIVELFLTAGMSPDLRAQGFTPLLEATRRGYEEMGLGLIDAGADVNSADLYGVSALMFSLISGSVQTARRLIEAGADVNARDVDGRTALIEALTTENDIPAELIAMLIDREAEVNVRTADGLTPLMIAASGSPGLLRLLIKAGADVNARDDSGVSVLRMAKDYPENARILEESGAKR